MAILKLNTNQTYEIALKFNTGKPVKSRFGAQMMFSLTDGNILYLPDDVGESIASLNLSPQEPFLLTRESTANKISWSVERKPVAAGPQLVKEPVKEPPVNGLPVNGQGSNALRIALHAVIDEAAEAEKYAAEKGLAIRFDGCDIRAFVNTMMIGFQHAGSR